MASTTVQMRPLLFLNVTQHWSVVGLTFRDNLSVPSSGSSSLTLEGGTNRLSLNISIQLPINTVLHPKRSKTQYANCLNCLHLTYMPKFVHFTLFYNKCIIQLLWTQKWTLKGLRAIFKFNVKILCRHLPCKKIGWHNSPQMCQLHTLPFSKHIAAHPLTDNKSLQGLINISVHSYKTT